MGLQGGKINFSRTRGTVVHRGKAHVVDVQTGEAALSGTAAVLAGVGTLIYRGTEHRVAGGEVGPLTRRAQQWTDAAMTGVCG